MNYRLSIANIKKDSKPVREIRGLLEILREAWVAARDKVYSDTGHYGE
jgi:flagellin-specific chaperone FliS